MRFAGLTCLLAVVVHLWSVQVVLAADRPGRDGFLLALPGYDFEFPRDHGAHEGYRTEWWYFSGHLAAAGGRKYGFEVTFFRVGIVPPGASLAVPHHPDPAPPVPVPGSELHSAWQLRNLSLAHLAITDISGGAFRYYQKLNRTSPFTATSATGYLNVFNESWRASTTRDGAWRLVAADGSDSLDLVLRGIKPPAIHGEDGVSVKAPGEGFASHYYSMSRLEVSGTINGRSCSGLAWMDHEFGSAELRENQRGWDWYAVQLDNDTELMLYVIRRADGTPDVSSSGSLITSDGNVVRLRRDQMEIRASKKWRSRKSGASYPMGWNVKIPSLTLRLELRPVMEEQELVTRASTGVTYWEGAVEVAGSSGGVPVRGQGYVEMTGYDRAFRAP